MTRRVLVALLAAGVAVPLVCSGTPASAAVAPAKPYDFDGDGRQELVASATGLKVGDMGWDARAAWSSSRPRGRAWCRSPGS